MAAAIVTTATSLEGQLLEVATALALKEQDVDAATRPNQVVITPNFEGEQVQIQAVLGVDIAAEGTGFKFTPKTYLS